MKLNVGDGGGSRPCGPSITGRERSHSAGSAAGEELKGNNHGTGGLDQRLATDPFSEVGRGKSGAPGKASVGGSAHPDLAEIRGVVPFQVAVSKKRAARPGVANDPVFVGAGTARADADGILPAQSIIRTAHDCSRS